MEYELINPLVSEIKGILDTSRQNVAKAVNNKLLVAYWKIGEIIVRYEQNDKVRAAYGDKTLKAISKELTCELGKGFSISNLQFMRRFYQQYQIQQTASVTMPSLELR